MIPYLAFELVSLISIIMTILAVAFDGAEFIKLWMDMKQLDTKTNRMSEGMVIGTGVIVFLEIILLASFGTSTLVFLSLKQDNRCKLH